MVVVVVIVVGEDTRVKNFDDSLYQNARRTNRNDGAYNINMLQHYNRNRKK